MALRFALLFTVLDRKPEPDQVVALFGLELAKRLYVRDLKTLTKILPIAPSEVPDTDGLLDRDRKIYFRICERPGLSPSELSRSFNRLRTAERDEVLASLVERNLVELKDGKLYRQEPRCSARGRDLSLPN